MRAAGNCPGGMVEDIFQQNAFQFFIGMLKSAGMIGYFYIADLFKWLAVDGIHRDNRLFGNQSFYSKLVCLRAKGRLCKNYCAATK